VQEIIKKHGGELRSIYALPAIPADEFDKMVAKG